MGGLFGVDKGLRKSGERLECLENIKEKEETVPGVYRTITPGLKKDKHF